MILLMFNPFVSVASKREYVHDIPMTRAIFLKFLFFFGGGGGGGMGREGATRNVSLINHLILFRYFVNLC